MVYRSNPGQKRPAEETGRLRLQFFYFFYQLFFKLLVAFGRERTSRRMEGSQSSTGKMGVWHRIFDLFFGYDYFIAHRSVDGKTYAAALCARSRPRETSSIAFST
jgi:hypothetical protein